MHRMRTAETLELATQAAVTAAENSSRHVLVPNPHVVCCCIEKLMQLVAVCTEPRFNACYCQNSHGICGMLL